jgi:hypothetical protein
MHRRAWAALLVVVAAMVLPAQAGARTWGDERARPREVRQVARLLDIAPREAAAMMRQDATFRKLARPAAREHAARLRTGRGLVVPGALLLAAGAIVGGVLLASSQSDYDLAGRPRYHDDQDVRLRAGIAVTTVGGVGGLALLIPGIVKLAVRSDAERALLDYAGTRPRATPGDAPEPDDEGDPGTPDGPAPTPGPTPAPGKGPAPTGAGVLVPLLSLRF